MTPIPDPAPIETLPVEFQVIRQGEGALFCLSPKGYEHLAKNQADTLRWVREAKWRLDYYGGELGETAEPEQPSEEADQ